MAELKKQRIFDKRSISGAAAVSRGNFLKVLLPLFACVLVFSVVSWPYIRDMMPEPEVPYSAPEVLHPTGANTALRPQFNGVDKNNQPYVLIADQGVQMGETKLSLTNAEFRLSLKTGETVTLRADTADYDQATGKVFMQGNVTLTHTTGYRFKTPKAWIDMNTSVAHGEDPVEGDGPAGTIQSPNGFRLSNHGEHIVFFGRSQLIINR